MKMLLCSDIKFGAVSAERLDSKLSCKWQSVRNAKFDELVDTALQNNAAYLVVAGRMFGQHRVTEGLIDHLFHSISSNDALQILMFLNSEEFERLSYRSDIPENLHILNIQTEYSYLDDDIAVRTYNEKVELQLADHPSIFLSKDDEGHLTVVIANAEYQLPSFEPLGFEEAEGSTFGFGLLEWTDDQIEPYKTHEHAVYSYKTIEVKIKANDDQEEIVRKINHAVKGIPYDCFLRIALTGRSAFGLTLNGDALKKQLQSLIFFVEVYDNTMMDIDEEAFATDISLCSEFVRLALADESLSESERNRLISCGWNALNGREVSEE